MIVLRFFSVILVLGQGLLFVIPRTSSMLWSIINLNLILTCNFTIEVCYSLTSTVHIFFHVHDSYCGYQNLVTTAITVKSRIIPQIHTLDLKIPVTIWFSDSILQPELKTQTCILISTVSLSKKATFCDSTTGFHAK